jgi:PAS domain S-box-containing protein
MKAASKWSAGLKRYAAAVGMVLAAAIVRWACLQALGNGVPYITFYPAVMFAALYGGLRAGVLATGLSMLLADYFWIVPTGRFSVAYPADRLSLVLFGINCLAIAWVCEAMHRARSRATEAEVHARLAGERERATQALRASEERFIAFAKAAFEGIVEVEAGRIVDCNEPFAQMVGRTVDELKGMALAELVAEADRGRVDDDLGGSADSFSELVMLRKNGARVLVEMQSRSVSADPSRRLKIVRDVTARRQGEETLHRLNRTLLALSRSSQAMFHATSETDYMNEVCRDIRECGHAMVWIGFAEHDAASTVRPVAHAGFEAGYLETLQLTWAETERGRGPTGTAIRTGRPAICQDMRTDANFAPWQAEALRRGYASSVVLPLIETGKTFGALTIYAREPQAFPPDEVQLLSELADDLAHGITALRETAARKLAETRLRRFYEADLFAVLYWKIDGGVIDVNDQFLKMTGYTREDVRAGEVNWARITPPEYQALDEEARRQVRESGIHRPYEKEFIRKDGTRVWGLFSATAYEDDRSQGISFILDITERKRAEATLSATRERLELALVSARMATFDWDIVRDLRTWDDNVHQLLGTSPATFAGQAGEFFKIIHPDDRSAVQAALDRARVTGSYETEYRAVWPDGSTRHIAARGTVLRDAAGQAVRMAGICWDITERRQAEMQTRLQAAALQAAANAIAITDRAGTIQWVNDAFAQLTGYGATEAVGQNPRVLKSGVHPPEFYAELWQTILAGRVWRNELVNQRKDGTLYTEEMTITPVRDGGGAITHFVAIKQDITARKQLELTLAKAKSALEQQNQELESRVAARTASLRQTMAEMERFAYVASHDLQEPLRTVSSFSQLLARRYAGKLDSDADEFIAFIVDGAARMQNLINDLLALSRVDTRAKPFAAVDCGEVLRVVQENLAAALTESGAVLTHDPLPRVLADRTQLIQLFQNLFSNAIKFRRPQAAPRIHVAVARQADVWQFSVRDNGIGIDPQFFDRIFIVFQRLHNRDEYPGTGIGLAICKKIVERHGGRLWVESEPGNGSTFHFIIPDEKCNHEKS